MAFLQTPLGGALLWLCLHSADWFLTILGARRRKLRAIEVMEHGGSYELNPLFQKVVDQGGWWSARFGLTLAVGAVMFALLNFGVAVEQRVFPGFGPIRDALLGGLVFTRVAVITRHLQNVWMFTRMAKDPEVVTGRIRYARPFVHQLSAVQFATVAVIVAVAALASPGPFLLGGAALCAMIAGLGWIQGLRVARKGVS